MLQDVPYEGAYGHTGGDPGITKIIFFDTTSELGYVYFSNTMIDNTVEMAVGAMLAQGNDSPSVVHSSHVKEKDLPWTQISVQ